MIIFLRILFIIGSLEILLPFFLCGQEVRVHTAWLKDTILIGQPAAFNIIIQRPENVSVEFKDLDLNFKPFLYAKKNIFKESKTISPNYSKDSVVYTLVTFEVDSLQALKLQYEYTLAGKQVIGETAPCTIFVKSVLSGDMLNEPLKKDTSHIPIGEPPFLWERLIQYAILLPLGIGGIIFLLRYGGKQLRILKIKNEWKQLVIQIQELSNQEVITPTCIYQINCLWQQWLNFLFIDVKPESMTSNEVKLFFSRLPFGDKDKTMVLYELKRWEEDIFYAQKQVAKESLLKKILLLQELLELGLRTKIEAIKLK
jgi:hypothetical protein